MLKTAFHLFFYGVAVKVFLCTGVDTIQNFLKVSRNHLMVVGRLPYLCCDKTTEVPIDPASNDDHGKNVSQVALQHVRHHRGVGHRVGSRSGTSLNKQMVKLLRKPNYISDTAERFKHLDTFNLVIFAFVGLVLGSSYFMIMPQLPKNDALF